VIEQEKIEVVINKRGIDVTVNYAILKDIHENSLYLFRNDIVGLNGIDTTNVEPTIEPEYIYQEKNAKMLLVQQDNTQLHQWNWTADEDINVQPVIFCYINIDVTIGSIVNFRNIKYKVVKKHTNRGLINFPLYELAKE
jgi:hypothetical protein